MNSVTNVYDPNRPEPNFNPVVVEAVRTIIQELNGGNRKLAAKSIYEAVRTDHRTLQQAFWSAILLAQIEYADNASDLRNEQAVKLAQMVRKAATEQNMDMGLPFI